MENKKERRLFRRALAFHGGGLGPASTTTPCLPFISPIFSTEPRERFLEPDPRALEVDEITLVVQVNGKIRGRITTAPGISEHDALALAHAEKPVIAALEGKTIRKMIFVPNKLVNIVAT